MGGSRKSSVASRKSSRGELDIPGAGEEPEHAVKKLNENRKMLLQQKLGGGGKLKKWENIDDQLHQRASDENHGSRKSSHESQGNIPAPPPPPIAPSFNKPLHVQTDARASTSPVSSFYSPGGSTPGIPDSRRPPPPVAPVLSGDLLESSRRAAVERERRTSTSTYQTEKTERYDLEEMLLFEIGRAHV